jgi:hypothetical protein
MSDLGMQTREQRDQSTGCRQKEGQVGVKHKQAEALSFLLRALAIAVYMPLVSHSGTSN